MNQPWQPRTASYNETLKYLHKRMKKEVTSLVTPWPKLNSIGVQGWEWGSVVTIAGRPGTGKSVIINQLRREVHKLNPGTNLRLLSFDLEMLSTVTAIREFSSHLQKSYNYLCSAEKDYNNKEFTEEELRKCWEYVKTKTERLKNSEDLKYPEDVVEVAPTVNEFEDIVHKYMEAYKYTDSQGKPQYINTLVSIDHIRLFRKESETENMMLYNAYITMTRLKREYGYPIIFVVLTHLGRDVNDESRTKPGEHSNYLRDSDIFGADSAVQNSDIVMVIDRPAARHISRYGPSYYIIDDTSEGRSILVFFFVKVRNGIPDAFAFFQGEFEKMRVIEREPPPKATMRVKSDQQNYNNNKPQNQTLFNNENK